MVHSHRDMVVISQHYGVDTLGVREEDVCFSAAKLFFAYGLGNAMTFPLWSGASAFYSQNVQLLSLTFDVIKRFRPQYFWSTLPFMLRS